MKTQSRRSTSVVCVVEPLNSVRLGCSLCTGLEEEDVFHELSRLLSRIKGNFQLTEIVSCDEYDRWANACAQLTVEAFRNWQWCPNADYYLMNFWSRMVATLPYLKGTKPSMLDTYVPEVCAPRRRSSF